MIPKIIHYCWVGPGKYSELIEKCLTSWRKQLPDYEFMLWNKENSPMDVKFVHDAYLAKKYPYAADYIRYWALYNYGGIYLDMDVFVIKNFDELLTLHSFWGSEHRDSIVIGTEVIGSEKGCPFLKSIMNRYENELIFNINKLEELKCPNVMRYVYDRTIDKGNITILPYDYFYPFPFSERDNISNFMSYTTNNTLAIHLWNMSWVPKWIIFKRRIKKIIKKMLHV